MKGLKLRDIWAMGHDERMKKLKDLRNDLMHERGVGAMGGALRSPGKVRAIRRTIAQILTVEAHASRMGASRDGSVRKARSESTSPQEKRGGRQPTSKKGREAGSVGAGRSRRGGSRDGRRVKATDKEEKK